MNRPAPIYPDNGHGAGTVAPDARAAERLPARHRDRTTSWPRLMTLELAGAYLSVSGWTIREYINAGDLPVVQARRPRTASALKHKPEGDALRRLLVDRDDLDRLADSFARERR